MEAKQYATENQWITEKKERGNQKIPRNKWKWKHDDPKPMGCSKSNSKREVYSNTSLPQELRKISNKQPNLMPKATEKEEQTKPKTNKRK